MFKTFNEKSFYEAIKEKDYVVLKTYTMNAILNDPTFSDSEIADTIEILRNERPEMFEKFKQLDYEEQHIDDKTKWNYDYFFKLVYYFRDNFALERLEEIKKVGKVACAYLKDSIKEENKHPFQQAPKQKKQSENRPKRRKSNRNRNIAISIGVGAGVIALVLVIAKILK